MIPIIAVAQEHQIYYFKDYAPYMRYDLPPITFSQEEKTIWAELANSSGQQNFVDGTEKLFALRENGVQVSSLTSELISFEDIDQQIEYFNRKKSCIHSHKNYITCLSKINKSLDEEKTIQQLIVGTEHSQLIFLDPKGQSIQ